MITINTFDYSCLAHLFFSKNDVHKLEPHIYNVTDIQQKNESAIERLNKKKYYYFKMPKCHHLQLTSLKYLKEHYLNNTLDNLSCHICNKLKDTQISYEQFTAYYSHNNTIPLHDIKNERGIDFTLTCLQCQSDTPYKELRWVLTKFKEDRNFNYCRNKCMSIGNKYPKVATSWNTYQNNRSPFDIIATDENMSHKKFWFNCSVSTCSNVTELTPYNVLVNSARCTDHKNNKNSFEEAAAYLSFSRIFSNISFATFTHRFKYEGNKEFDIYVEIDEHSKFAVEIDGDHHKNLFKQDCAKNDYANRHHIFLVRIRSKELRNIHLTGEFFLIQHQTTKKAEINETTRLLLLQFKDWVNCLQIENDGKNTLLLAIQNELTYVDVIRDELVIYDIINLQLTILLKDQPALAIVWEQLHPDLKLSHGHVITRSEQNIKRIFICKDCNYEWSATVHSVVRNFKNSQYGSTGCPKCANKVSSANDALIKKARHYRNLGYTQKEIGQLLNRSQPTISQWNLDDR